MASPGASDDLRRQGNTFDGTLGGGGAAVPARRPARWRLSGVIPGAWALVSARRRSLYLRDLDRLGGGSTVCFIFVVVGMTVLIAATAKAVLMRVGAPFVGFAAMAVLQENVEFSAAHFGWLATSGLVFGGYILGTAALVYRPRRSIVTHSKITSECIRIVLYAYVRVGLRGTGTAHGGVASDDSSSAMMTTCRWRRRRRRGARRERPEMRRRPSGAEEATRKSRLKCAAAAAATSSLRGGRVGVTGRFTADDLPRRPPAAGPPRHSTSLVTRKQRRRGVWSGRGGRHGKARGAWPRCATGAAGASPRPLLRSAVVVASAGTSSARRTSSNCSITSRSGVNSGADVAIEFCRLEKPRVAAFRPERALARHRSSSASETVGLWRYVTGEVGVRVAAAARKARRRAVRLNWRDAVCARPGAAASPVASLVVSCKETRMRSRTASGVAAGSP